MIHAYDEMYVDSAMNNLGDAFDYVASDLNMDKDEFLKLFISTGIAEEFGNGNPKYIMGMSGPELVEEVLNEAGIERLVPPSSARAGVEDFPDLPSGFNYEYYYEGCVYGCCSIWFYKIHW